jgi:pimeloyl-ACP methyl ester carboxylesterase
MFYEVPARDARGYGAPYRYLPANSGPSVEPFAYMSTGIPQHFLRDLREKPLWKVCEAFCPKSFNDLNTLALVSERIDSARRYLRENRSGDQDEATARRLRSVVVFGERDPLGRDYKEALLCVIGKNNLADWAIDGIMLENAGHYPMEDKPEDVAQLITRFA